MSLPEVVLDDRRFQDLVDEARMRIAQSCPEWTEHNVSDPGITLIELFAWMTEMLVYRINRVPEKLHVAFLDLLGLRLDPPAAASTSLRFLLAAPAARAHVLAAGTEVGTLRTAGEQSIVFRTREDVTVPALRPVAYALERGGRTAQAGVDSGTARPTGTDRLAFGSPPQVGDALLLGFDEPLDGLVVRVDVEGSAARGAGVDPEDPPLAWEASGAGGAWLACEVLRDTTGGFNYGDGSIELQLPTGLGELGVGGQRARWLRCRLDDRARSGRDGASYSHAPELHAVTAWAVGALADATHAGLERGEALGHSDGTPGQRFELQRAPVLAPEPTETLEVREPGSSTWRSWTPVESFASSGPQDRHYLLGLSEGVVELGPAIRQSDGGWRRYGATPPKGAELRMAAYRHGGGSAGNVSTGTLTVLKSAVPGVATVTNPHPAAGGVDPEGLDVARSRAALELRSRYRAVTVEDHEFLAVEASPRVARARCVALPGEPVRVHLVPRLEPADRYLELDELLCDTELLDEVAAYLEQRRIVGTTIDLLPAGYRGFTAVVELEASPVSDLERVQHDVAHALETFLNPLVGGDVRGPGGGWGFGRPLNQGELYGVIHAVEGVDVVRVLRVYETDLVTGEQHAKPIPSHVPLAAHEVVVSARHVVRAVHPDPR